MSSRRSGYKTGGDRRPHVALIVETSIDYGRGILRGVARYLREHRPWSLFIEHRELRSGLPAWLPQWRGDGIITRSDSPRILGTGIPTVGLYDRIPGRPGLPMIVNDNAAIGRLAVRHLLDRGFKEIAFYGLNNEHWSQLRFEGARQAVALEGGRLHLWSYSSPDKARGDWEKDQDSLAKWFRSLPKPLGLVGGNDVYGLRALDACKRAGLSVPEQFAVIGADNDRELCDLSDPPLTSVAFNPERVGYEAAMLLDQLMEGRSAPQSPQLVPPLSVIHRQSTDILAVSDPQIIKALRFIRENACEGISVHDVVEQVTISRRSLEQGFHKLLGRTPKGEIQRVRIERAKLLLAETGLSIMAISQRTGFNQAAYFTAVFHTETGTTPCEYRRGMASRRD